MIVLTQVTRVTQYLSFQIVVTTSRVTTIPDDDLFIETHLTSTLTFLNNIIKII